MKVKRTTVDVKIAWTATGKMVNASVRREVESALEAYQDANQSIINIARKYADRVLLQQPAKTAACGRTGGRPARWRRPMRIAASVVSASRTSGGDAE